MKCILGGTFSVLHAGHDQILNAALAFDDILIGLTSDSYCKENKIYPVIPYEKRKANLEARLKSLLKKSVLKRKFEIIRIDDKQGFAPSTDADAIIVSQETEKTAESINKLRAFNLRNPLRIISIPLAYAQDYIKISSRRIHEKKITPQGKRLKPVILALGSENPSKKEGLHKAAKRLFRNFRIKAMKAKSDISEQPFDQETVSGAINRAKAAYFATGADFGIGFESGIFQIQLPTIRQPAFQNSGVLEMGEDKQYFDMAICAIFDGEITTLGNSMGFQMPPRALRLLSSHKDLGAVMEELSGIEKIGYRKGAIHYLSAGLLDRQQMHEQAFLCAMIPRISEAKNIFRYF